MMSYYGQHHYNTVKFEITITLFLCYHISLLTHNDLVNIVYSTPGNAFDCFIF